MNEILTIPWVEKYRPNEFDKIVLDPLNKKIMETILLKNHFPNLLLYGPPGTGKTTTIINLVNAYQEKYNQKNKGLMIHLNASDERGIDIIRNQINAFVNSSGLFSKGIKFVILDEVDYMTKNAQQALKYLLQSYNKNVRFCLICNYISRIDESLQNEFMRLRFNQLPEREIVRFLFVINNSENIKLSESTINSIQKLYKSDIRSMINYMQTNQNIIGHSEVIDNSIWENLTSTFLNNESREIIIKIIVSISGKYNIEIKNIIKDYLNFIIRFKPEYINKKLLQLLGTAVAGYVGIFFLNALPVAGAMVALIKINEEKISNTVSPLLNKTIGLGIDELRLIAGGPNVWQKNGASPSSEQFRLASKIVPEKDTTKIVDLGNLSNEEIKSLEKPTQELLVNKGDELMSNLKEESMTIANEDPNLYMKEAIELIDSPCNKYLEKIYKEGNAKYVLGGEKGTILKINGVPAALVYGDPDTIQINGKNICV